MTRSFDVFFDLRLNKRLSKQSWGWWFETLSPSLWRHRNVNVTLLGRRALSFFSSQVCYVYDMKHQVRHDAQIQSTLHKHNPSRYILPCHGLLIHGMYLHIFEFASINHNMLYMHVFQRELKHIFTFYVTSPHWHDTGSSTRSSSKTRTYLSYTVNIMGADVLATQGARASATMILTRLCWNELIKDEYFCALRINIFVGCGSRYPCENRSPNIT